MSKRWGRCCLIALIIFFLIQGLKRSTIYVMYNIRRDVKKNSSLTSLKNSSLTVQNFLLDGSPFTIYDVRKILYLMTHSLSAQNLPPGNIFTTRSFSQLCLHAVTGKRTGKFRGSRGIPLFTWYSAACHISEDYAIIRFEFWLHVFELSWLFIVKKKSATELIDIIIYNILKKVKIVINDNKVRTWYIPLNLWYEDT